MLRSGKAREAGTGHAKDRRLTEEEKRVLVLLAVGTTTNEIAAELTISPDTVRAHVPHHNPDCLVCAAYPERSVG
jgi:DNA-binding NarL/FixJ family response regulator